MWTCRISRGRGRGVVVCEVTCDLSLCEVWGNEDRGALVHGVDAPEKSDLTLHACTIRDHEGSPGVYAAAGSTLRLEADSRFAHNEGGNVVQGPPPWEAEGPADLDAMGLGLDAEDYGEDSGEDDGVE